MSSNDHLNRLLQSIHDTYPNMIDRHVLSGIFPSLLLALVAQNTSIMFNASNVVDVQKSTAKVLSTVFGLKTKQMRIRSPLSSHDLLSSLFISLSPASSSTSSNQQRTSGHTRLPRAHSAPRPSSSHFTEGSDSTAPPAPSPLPRYKTDPLPRGSGAQPNFHLPQTMIISGLERGGRAAQLALAEVLRTRRVVLESTDMDSSVHNLPDGFFVIFISPIGDGRERPDIHTSLLDHFAFGTTLTQTTTTATSSPSPRLRQMSLPPSSPNPPLLPYDQLPQKDPPAISPLISHYIAALFTAARHHPELDGALLTARCARFADLLVRASGAVFRDGEECAMISEAHVRRVIPPVLLHRLRVRDGPREQVMGILWEGAGVHQWGKSQEVSPDARRTVKEILVEILAEV